MITGYTPFAAEGEEAAEMALWASDLAGGIEGFVAGYEARHGALPDDVRQRWLANDGQALAACVATMIAESDGSQVGDLPRIPRRPWCWSARKNRSSPSHERRPPCASGEFVALPGLDHVQTFLRSDMVLPEVERSLSQRPEASRRIRSGVASRWAISAPSVSSDDSTAAQRCGDQISIEVSTPTTSASRSIPA